MLLVMPVAVVSAEANEMMRIFRMLRVLTQAGAENQQEISYRRAT